MHEIVRIEFIEGEAVVSHEQLAEGMGIKAVNVRQLIQKHTEDFEQFGRLMFETEGDIQVLERQRINPNYRARKIYYLNEQQATLALTYFRNSDTVRAFKVALVKSFYKMRSQLKGEEGGMSGALGALAQGFETMAESVRVLADGQAQIIELIGQLQSNTPVRADAPKGISSAQKEQLVCVNPEFHDNHEERELFTMNIVEILKRYPAGMSQGVLLGKSDYPESTRTRRWLQDGIGAFWNMQIKPGRGYLYFL